MEHQKTPAAGPETPEALVVDEAKKADNSLTLSTKLSTDHLICKTPQDSPNGSVRSLDKFAGEVRRTLRCTVLYLGVMQLVLGFLMVVFGVVVIVQEARLSQLGGGIWGGCLAIATGVAGVLAGAKDWCPLKDTAQKVAHTTFLALSLVSLAIAQLVLVLAATGFARDLSKTTEDEDDPHYPTTTTPSPKDYNSFLDGLPANFPAILANFGLLIISFAECVVAAVASYKGARALCPCFRVGGEDRSEYECHVDHRKHALVSSWLGKQNMNFGQQFYVIAAPPSSLGKGSKISSGLPVGPVYAIPPPRQRLPPPQILSYPLIPAPLGPIPSPIIRHHPSEMIHKKRRRHHKEYRIAKPSDRRRSRSRSSSKPKEKTITTEDVAKTYTGLDRAIAEEFIDICESQNMSLCSESSCQSSCQSSGPSSVCRCQHPCAGCANTCNAGNDILAV